MAAAASGNGLASPPLVPSIRRVGFRPPCLTRSRLLKAITSSMVFIAMPLYIIARIGICTIKKVAVDHLLGQQLSFSSSDRMRLRLSVEDHCLAFLKRLLLDGSRVVLGAVALVRQMRSIGLRLDQREADDEA